MSCFALITASCGGGKAPSGAGRAWLLAWLSVGREVVVLLWMDETLSDIIVNVPLVSLLKIIIYALPLIYWY